MTLPALLGSVCAAAGIIEHERLAIVVMFEREGSGLRRNSIDNFEYFLMVIDVADLWKEEGRRMLLLLSAFGIFTLQLSDPYT